MSNIWNTVLVVGLLIAFAVVASIASAKRGRSPHEQPRRKQPLTNREQAMFLRLREAFPDSVVLAQVAFSALLDARTASTRNTFDKKVTDFALCSSSFEVVALIELDDSSHRNRASQDARRAKLLTDAGYRVHRFNNIPQVAALRAAIEAPTPQPDHVTLHIPKAPRVSK